MEERLCATLLFCQLASIFAAHNRDKMFSMQTLTRFILLYGATYAAFGVASPFLPAFLSKRGLLPEQLGFVLAAGTAIRLLTSPLAGRIGDLIYSLRGVLVVCLMLAAAVTLGYFGARGFWLLLGMSLLHAAALAPITILSDALALGASSAPSRSFEYGWVRGAGSAAFILGTLFSGQAVSALGLEVIIGPKVALLGAAACSALAVPEVSYDRVPGTARVDRGGVIIFLRTPLFRNMVIVAALILGSHGMHDAFAVIRWSAAGIKPSTVSLLWSESVAAEVIVFFLIGPVVVTGLTPTGAVSVAALAGILRWVVMAQTTDLLALALIQPLQGVTFALLHLACMRLLSRIVPNGLEGTAQAVYGTVGIGLASALLTLVSGKLYARMGAQGFWVMALLCFIALPLTDKLREPKKLNARLACS